MASLKKNITYNVIYHILVLILPLITAPYISRILGPEGVGIYSYTNSVAHYFVVFAMLGLTKYGNRTIARVRDNKEELSKTFCNLYALQAIVASLALLAYLIYFVGFNEQYRVYFLIQLLNVGSALFNINWFFFGMEKFKLTVTRNAIIKIIATICIFIFVKTPEDLGIYIGITAGSILLSNIILWRFLFRHIKFVKPDFKKILSHIKPLLILFIPVVAVSIYRTMDKIMITLLSDVVQTGIYENADKIVLIPFSIITALGTVMLPRMSNIMAQGNEEKSRLYIRDSMQFVLCLSVAMMFGLAAVGEIFAPLYFGEAFADSGTLIKWLSPVVVIAAWANVIRTQYLIPKGKDKVYVVSVILGAVANLVLNLIFVPRYGALGAVVGTIAAEGSVMLYQSIMTRKELQFSQYFNDNFLFLISGGIMYISLRIISKYIKDGYGELIFLIILGMLIYGIMTFILFYLFKRDRLMHFKKYFKVKKKD